MKSTTEQIQCIHGSVARISDLHKGFEIHPIPRSQWAEGDYVVAQVTDVAGSDMLLELPSGRGLELMDGDLVLGALGTRHATLEVTGSWEKVGEDGAMHILTGGAVFGMMTSISVYMTSIMEIQYKGHAFVDGERRNMMDYAADPPITPFEVPVILFVGTSMSSGKTTSARIITKILKELNLRVTALKLTGAGRYRDILHIQDAGADHILDFMDVGLNSSICPLDVYDVALQRMLSLAAANQPDVAVIEIGASPLEPYNGEAAIAAIRDQVVCTVLCASDPYAVLGVMHSFDLTPDIVSGPAVNTLGGEDLIYKLCGVRGINIVNRENAPVLREIIISKLGLSGKKKSILKSKVAEA